jgi:DNA-binding transcriptional ArsR family regulator
MVASPSRDLFIIRDPEVALALLDPERRRLTEALAVAPDSAAGLARRLGEKRQRLNYHLRVLEEAGLVEAVDARPRGARSERVLRPTARRFVLDPAAVGNLAGAEPGLVGDRFAATYLVALAARAVRELADLLERAAARRARVATVSLNTRLRLASPARLQSFVDELTEAVAEVVARHHRERGPGRWFRVIAGAYPAPALIMDEEEESDDRATG